MKIRSLFGLLLWVLILATTLVAGSRSGKVAPAGPAVQAADADNLRIEGEKRYHANCGRCHATPQKFPPRMMATVLRHMQVRATITDEDRRLILFYMTQ